MEFIAAVPEPFASPRLIRIQAVSTQPSAAALTTVPASFSDLGQQILQTASVCEDGELLPVKLANLVGKAFQADGCLIIVPSIALSASQIGYWLEDNLTGLSQTTWGTSIPFVGKVTTAEPCFSADVTVADKDNDVAMQQFTGLWQNIAASHNCLLSVRAVLFLATQFQGEMNGVICLMRSHPSHWTTVEVEELRRIAQPLAVSISHLQLRHQLNRRVEYQTVINQLTLAVHNSPDLKQFLSLATEGTARALKAQRSMLLRLKHWDPRFKASVQEQMTQARVVVACEWQDLTSDFSANAAVPAQPPSPPVQEDPVPESSFWIAECGLCQEAFLQAPNPIVIGDSLQNLKIDPSKGVADLFQWASLPSLLMAPLESQGTVLGFLVFQHNHPHVWQPEEVELVKLVCAQVSTAIIQTETLRQVQMLVEKRTAELRESLSIQAKLYERTRQQIDQLRKLNQLKDEFLSTISHELRTPLTSMTMAIRMLRQVTLTDPRSARYLDILEQQCTQETNLINDLLTLQELETRKVAIYLQDIDLKALLQEQADSFQQRWANKGLSLSLDLPRSPLILRSDRESLQRIVLELLTNAGKYAEPNSTVDLKARFCLDASSQEVVLSLTNTGAGISPEELPHIFEKFRRCQGATQNAIQGTGLGLSLVKSLVQLLNGTISVTSQPLEHSSSYRTSFDLAFPQTLDSSKP
jgi:signal transduction histidine kinase